MDREAHIAQYRFFRLRVGKGYMGKLDGLHRPLKPFLAHILRLLLQTHKFHKRVHEGKLLEHCDNLRSELENGGCKIDCRSYIHGQRTNGNLASESAAYCAQPHIGIADCGNRIVDDIDAAHGPAFLTVEFLKIVTDGNGKFPGMVCDQILHLVESYILLELLFRLKTQVITHLAVNWNDVRHDFYHGIGHDLIAEKAEHNAHQKHKNHDRSEGGDHHQKSRQRKRSAEHAGHAQNEL